MALSNAERQRAYRARKRGEAEASLESRVKALSHVVSGLEVAVRALEGRLRSVEDGGLRPVTVSAGEGRSVTMNPAMQAFVQQHPPRPVTVPTVSSPSDDWDPA